MTRDELESETDDAGLAHCGGAVGDDLEEFAPAVDLPIDVGIRRAVLVLRQAGIETFESCEGGEGHAFTEPTIKFSGGAWAGYKAFAVAMENGLPVARIQMVWHELDKHLQGPWWEMVFSRTMD
jgi:hypothetical protein